MIKMIEITFLLYVEQNFIHYSAFPVFYMLGKIMIDLLLLANRKLGR